MVWIVLSVKDFKTESNYYISGKDGFSSCILILIVFLLLHLSYFSDIIFFEQGFKIRTGGLTETVFHLGIINNLQDLYPPLYPYASGYSFSYYHLNMHLEIEMFHRLFSVDTVKLTFFYFPSLYFTLLVFLPYFFVLEIGATRLIGVLTGMFLFGSDLSFIMGLFGKLPPDYSWVGMYSAGIMSIMTLNGILPALIVMFLFILFLFRFDDSGKGVFLIILCILGYSAYGFKSSMGFHLAGALFLSGLATVGIAKDKKKGLMLCGASIITIVIMIFDLLVFRGGTGGVGQKASIDLFHSFERSLASIGTVKLPLLYYPVVFIGYALATFGARAFGFVLIKDVFRERYFNLVVFFLVVFAVSGFFFSEVISVGSPGDQINNAMWFSAQSLFGAWLLVSYFLMEKRRYQKGFITYIIIIMLFSLPSTVQFLSLRHNSSYWHLNSDAQEVVSFLKKIPPESKVLHPLNKVPSLASDFAGRTSIINTSKPFALSAIGEKNCLSRISDVKSFFSKGNSTGRSLILKKYKVDYVYAPIEYMPMLDKEACLSEVLKNNDYVVYGVRRECF
ncbi:MAG: hypothetical protein OEW04_05640 [Nitrospirota bacterium]|nr:hypothetical protein [Nitrospirota bacterium]